MQTEAAGEERARVLRALIVDWGGVLTMPLGEAMTSWAQADGVDFAHFADVMRRWVGPPSDDPAGDDPAGAVAAGDESRPGGGATAGDGAAAPGGAAEVGLGGGGGGAGDGGGLDWRADVEAAEGDGGGVGGGGVGGGEPGWGSGRPSEAVLAELEGAGVIPASPVHALERGELSVPEFERELAAALGERGSPVPAEGLLQRVLGGLEELRPDMLGLVRRARAAGIRTALLSNSWGDSYDEDAWEGAFDVVVISGRVGMRKPEARIFEHTAELLGVPAAECVMVDDLAPNIRGAVATGMVGVLHTGYETTAEELEVLFDRPLR